MINFEIATEKSTAEKENLTLKENFKKRKIDSKNNENDVKNANFCENFAKSESALDSTDNELLTYIKVLLSAHKTLPKTIDIIDKLIKKRASTFIPTSAIFGDGNTTYAQINRVIDMTERKDKLLNLYFIGEKLMDSLDEDLKPVAFLRYSKGYQAAEIASSLNRCSRTIFRKLNKINLALIDFANKQGWTLAFIKDQIGSEAWLNDLYKKKVKEEIVNKQRANALRK